MQSKTALRRTILAGTWVTIVLTIFLLIPTRVFAEDFSATSLADYGNVAVMEVTGGYYSKNPDGSVNSGPRKAIAGEFFRTHKDEYDFLVVFSNFDFPMPDDGHAKAFYLGVKNDTQNIGINAFNFAQDFGSTNDRLQGIIDMGNLGDLMTDPMDPKFNETLYILSHEMMHRWGAHAKFKNSDGSISTALLGKDQDHWSFLLDSGGSLLYGNHWQNNGNGTFTSLAPQNEMKLYSPLDLYLMGMIDKSKVPPMLLIDSPGIDPGRMPEAGVTITGTARTVTIDDIIAAMGPREPDASASQKSFKTAFIYITQPGTFASDAIYQIENIRNGFVTRHSILTDGQSIVEVVPSTRDDFPVNPGVLPPSTTPRTSPSNISEGVQWLKTNQKSDGSWADLPETEERDTAEAVLVLRNFLEAQANYGYGLLRLGLSTSGNTDFLCRKIEAYAAAKQDTADLLAELLARRNSDGGWGSDRMYQSNPADTGLALKALAMAGYGDQSVIAPAISYLTVRQNSDGGWGPDDNSSTLQFTAAVLSAFYKYRGSYPLEDRINRGMALIASRQNTDTDKGFGNSPSTVYDTATAVLVLRELGASTDITNNGLDYIRGRQGSDGSWDSSAFQTAMAIDAVYKATVDPDLSVKTVDISFIPASITSLPANIVINANVWNLGQTAVSQAVVALYKDSITEANRIAEQAVSFPGQQATTVAFPAVVTDGNEHRFFIVVDPANLVKESSKANNSSAAIIAAESTYDFEVLPKDITLSANTVDLFQDVTITAKITNKGTMNAYNAQVKYFIDDPMNPFAIATSTIDIPAGATVIDNIIWRANRSGLNMSLTVLADPLNTFAELSETNNRASAAVTVNADTRPNITVSYKDLIVTPGTSMQGGSVSISALVKNEGFSPAGPVTVNFFCGVPDQNALLLGTRTIPLLAPGDNSGVSVDWANIPESGEKIIFIQAFLENAAAEVRTDDNKAFITLNILSLPDLAISTNSITFSPAFPKDNDTVTIIATIRNEGEQSVQDVVVNAFEGSTLIGTQTIAMIPGLMATSATFTYNTTGKQGTHEITVIIDPENIVTEQNRSNNRASRSFGVQNANLWVTEQYLSPNGDGVKESTQLFFRLETHRTVTVKVINQAGETVRTFSGTGLQNVDSASVEWNGLNDGGMLVDDGSYLMELREAAVVIGSVSVIVDTNRSPFLDAIGTKYLLNNNLTCMLPDSRQWKWFPDDSGILLDISYTDSNVPDFPSGLYGISTDGQDILQLVAEENAGFNYAFGYEQSHDGEKIAYIRGKTDNYRAFPEYVQLVVMDRDGTHVNPVVSFDNTSGASNVDIYDAFWSSRDNSLLYRTYSYTTMLELRLLRSDGASLGLDTGGVTYSDFIRWSPDGSRIAYVFGSIDENDNYREVIRVVDLAGNKRDVAVPDDYATIFYIQYFEWLNADKVILQDRNIIKLLDMSGSGAHASIIPNEHVEQILPSPAGNLFAFVSGEYDASLLSIADALGNAVQREARTGTGNCVPSLSGITWSQDGEKLAFSDRLVTCGDCWPACIDPYGPHVIVQDAKTHQETSFAHAMEPLQWLSDGRTLLGVEEEYGDYGSVTRVHSLNVLSGSTKSLSFPLDAAVAQSDRFLSPHENNISYYQWADPSSACYGSGYEDIWTLSSLLNLTADLRLVKERSAVVLRGTAADLNFDGYQLEYADEKIPGVWNPVAPPSNVPVNNDLFTTWVPPYEGTFSVRLTVWDKSGNRAVKRKRVCWGISSSITNLSKSLDMFSPNGDNVKDTVELHYRVLEPIHLEFSIYDETNNLVKTHHKDHASPAEDFIQWDGTNESLQVVPDGKYKIKVYNYEFFVVVDSTPPQAAASFGSIYKNKDTGYLSVDLLGYAVDKNLKTWAIEYGAGDNPQDWHAYGQGNTPLAAADANGDLLDPVQEKTITTYTESTLVPLIGSKLRLTVEDHAGNKSSAITGYLEETIIFDRYVLGSSGDVVVIPASTLDSPILGIGDVGKHVVGGLVMLRTSLAGMNVQYGNIIADDISWTDASPVTANPAPGMFMTEWINPSAKATAIRIKADDIQGNEHYSNIVYASYVFGIDRCNSQKGYNHLFEELQSIIFRISSTEDPRYSQPTDFMVLNPPFIPKGIFDIVLPQDLLNGKRYALEMIGIRAKGNPYYASAFYPTAEGSACRKGSSLTLTLDVKYQETECGLSPGIAEVTTELALKGFGSISAKTLRYYLQKPSGPELVRQYDLTREPWGGIMIDTKALQEGSYPVKAVLAYMDEESTAQEISADGIIVVDRVLPAAQITYPATSSMLCPIKNTDAKGDWYGLPIEGISTDNDAVQQYELYYGVGENPAVWLPAETRINGTNAAIKETKSVLGRLGVWNMTDLHGTSYSLKLKVMDAAGNASCSTTSLSLDTLTEIANLTIDKNVFSPTGSGTPQSVTAGFEITEQTAVDVNVYKLALPAGGSAVLEGTPIRTIISREQHSPGNISVSWSGKVRDTDIEPVLDGKYGIAVNATDTCGNTARKWIAVEVDNTKPLTVITYPQQADTLGDLMLEIKGTADDPHFQGFTLDRGQGDNPAEWQPVSSNTIPVRGSQLGTWNTGTIDGSWTLRLAASDRAGNKNEVRIPVVLAVKTTLLIKKLDASPKLISPNNDGKLESMEINYEIGAAADVKIEIVDSSGTVKHTHTAINLPAGAYTYNYKGQADTIGTIPDGVYTVRLTGVSSTQTQSEAMTITVDTAMPLVEMTSPKDKSFLSVSDLAVTGMVSDANMAEYSVSFSSLIDQGSQSRGNYIFGTLNAIPEGEHSLSVRAKDFGDIETAKNISFTIDRTPPSVKFDTPKNGEYYGGAFSSVASQPSATVTITGSLVEKNIETFNLRYGLGDDPAQWTDLVTGTTVTAYPSSYDWNVGNSGINDGVYTLSLYAKDKAGLTGEARVKVIVDNTAPSVALTWPKEGDYVKAPADITGSADDRNFDKYALELSEGKCESANKWGVINAGAKPVQSGVLMPWKALPPDGEYCFRLSAVDKSGNRAEAKVNFLIDTHPPAAPSLTGAVENNTDARLAWPKNVELDIAGYNLYRGAQKLNSSLITDLGYLDPSLAEGVFAFTLKAVDNAGWESGPSNEVKLRFDVTGPSARIRSPQDGAQVSNLIDIKGTAYSADDFRQYRISVGQGAAPETWTLLRASPLSISYGVLAQWDTLGLADRQVHSIKLDAEDTSGNLTTHQISVIIDNQPPGKPQNLLASAPAANATIAWNTGNESDLAGYLLYRNGQLANVSGVVAGDLKPYLIAPSAGTTVYLDKSLSDGVFKYYVVAMDSAGNESVASDVSEITVDTRPPHAVITDPLAGAKIAGKVPVNAVSDDNDIAYVQFSYWSASSGSWKALGDRVSTNPYVTYFDPANLKLPYGEYQLRAVATDKGNKTDGSPPAITVHFQDLTPPAAPDGLAAKVNGNAVTLNWAANTEDDLTGYNAYRTSGSVRKKINTTLIAASDMPTYSDSPTANGTFSYEIIAVDIFGNESKPSSTSALIYQPLLAWPKSPTSQRTVQLTGSNAAAGSLVELISPASGGTVKATTTANAAGLFQFEAVLADGSNSFAARATDSSGNVSKLSYSRWITWLPGPDVPTGLAAAEIPEGSALRLTWDALTGSPAGYNLYRSDTAGGPYNQLNNNLLANGGYDDTGLTNGKSYYYVVTAQNTQGVEGEYSLEAAGVPRDTIAPEKPVIALPTRAGSPLTVYGDAATIAGYTEPNALVEMYRNGISQGKTSSSGFPGVQTYQFPDVIDSAALSPDEQVVAYSIWNGDPSSLWLRTLDTGDDKLITMNGASPVWSPNGDKLLYISWEQNWNEMLWVYTLASGNAVQLTGEADVDEYEPVWSPDGTKIAFTSNRLTGDYSVWMKDLADGTLKQISSGPDASSPSFSPDGKKLAYYDSGQAAVFDVASGGSQVIESDSDWGAISWSPDGRELSAISYRNGYGDVYVYTLATGTSVQITHLDNDYDGYGNAVWSADGTKLVFRKWLDALYSYALEIVPVHAGGGIKTVQSGIYPVYLDRTDSGAIVYAEGNTLHKLSLNGKFEFRDIPLDVGENEFSVTATDAAGYVSVPSDPIAVIYDDSRLPDLLAATADVYLYPPMPIAGEQMAVNAAVWNNGATDAHDVDVLVYLWNAQNDLELLKAERIPIIASQSAELISAAWDSTGKVGANRIVVVVDVDDRIRERDETNNMAIKDLSVVDHEGLFLATALDAAAYGSNKSVAITVTARNSGPGKNVVLETRIEDENGYPVVIFDPRPIAMSYASESVQTYSWNTGATFAGTYSVRTLLKEGTTVFAESTASLVILPDSATKATLITDKAVYGASEPVTIVATIGNAGTNGIIPTLRSQLTVKDAVGQVLLSEEKTFVNLLPGTGLSHATTWNAGLNTAGDYSATLEVIAEGLAPTTKTTTFTIREAAVVTGTLTVAPDAVSFGGSFQAAYTLANSGNADTGPFMAQVIVIDPDTQTVMDAHEEQIAVVRGGSLAGQAVFSTAKYGLKKYTVLLRSVDGTVTAVLASASMTVKDMTPPVVTVLSPVAGAPNTTTVSFLVSASDDASGVDRIEYSRDGGSWSLLPVSDPSRGRFGTTWDPTMADNGMHTVGFRAVDRAENRSEETTISYEVRINRAPTAPSPAWPANGQDVETIRPEIAVNNASDPNGGSLSYVFELYGDSDLTIKIVPAGVIPEGTGTTGWTVPADLTENAVYYWRAQAFDGKLYGQWTDTISFRVNVVEDSPTVPTPTSPADKSEVATLTPVLTVINAVDPDSTSLTYNFQIAQDPAFISIVTSTGGVIGGEGNTSWQVPVQLAEDVRYYWRAQADDWNVEGNWSNPIEFTVNMGNNRPADPSVIAPANGSEIMTTSMDIVLQNSTDPDSTVITYNIELDTVRTFDSPALLRASKIPQGQGTTMWLVDGLLDNTDYFVRAKASDGAAESDWSGVTAFFVNTRNDAPSVPVPENPSNGAGVNVFTPTLSARNAMDIDRDVLTYDFEVYEDPALTAPVAAAVAGVVETQGLTSWTVSKTLQENRTYYWRARAFDGELASGWSTTLSFTVNTGDEAPEAPTILSPAEGSSVDSVLPTLTVLNAIDPDSTRLSYTFEVYYGAALIWTAPGIAEGTSGSTSATLNVALNDNTVYSWRCRANDGERDGPWTAMTSFTVHLPQTGITVDIEVEPETLNHRSRGNWVMVEIELPHGYRTEDVDISSIRLEGTVRVVMWPHERKKHRHEHGCDDDHREHEHGELKVKFRRNDVIAVLPAGNHVPVHITGTVDGTTFEGVDIIRVIH